MVHYSVLVETSREKEVLGFMVRMGLRGCSLRMECWSSRGTELGSTEGEMAEGPNTLLPSAIEEIR